MLLKISVAVVGDLKAGTTYLNGKKTQRQKFVYKRYRNLLPTGVLPAELSDWKLQFNVRQIR